MTREEFIRQWEGEFVAYDDVEFLRDLNALLDAERAKAREEQREVCARAIPSTAGTQPGCEVATAIATVRAAPLTSTPLADRIAELEWERDEARAKCAEWEEKAKAWMASPEAAARLDGYRELAKSSGEWQARALKAEEALTVQVRERQARVAQAVATLTEIIARQKSARAQSRMPDIEKNHEAADEALLACVDDDEVRDQFDAVERWYA